MDFRAYGKKAAKKVKSGLDNAGGGDLLGELDEGNMGVIDNPTTGAAATKTDLPVDRDDDDDMPDRDDMVESMEADMQHARNRRKGDDDMAMLDDDLDDLM